MASSGGGMWALVAADGRAMGVLDVVVHGAESELRIIGPKGPCPAFGVSAVPLLDTTDTLEKVRSAGGDRGCAALVVRGLVGSVPLAMGGPETRRRIRATGTAAPGAPASAPGSVPPLD